MRSYIITTATGRTQWWADDEQHALEQHADDYAETVQDIREETNPERRQRLGITDVWTTAREMDETEGIER